MDFLRLLLSRMCQARNPTLCMHLEGLFPAHALIGRRLPACQTLVPSTEQTASSQLLHHDANVNEIVETETENQSSTPTTG
jgi:hypothetical protein